MVYNVTAIQKILIRICNVYIKIFCIAVTLCTIVHMSKPILSNINMCILCVLNLISCCTSMYCMYGHFVLKVISSLCVRIVCDVQGVVDCWTIKPTCT